MSCQEAFQIRFNLKKNYISYKKEQIMQVLPRWNVNWGRKWSALNREYRYFHNLESEILFIMKFMRNKDILI